MTTIIRRAAEAYYGRGRNGLGAISQTFSRKAVKFAANDAKIRMYMWISHMVAFAAIVGALWTGNWVVAALSLAAPLGIFSVLAFFVELAIVRSERRERPDISGFLKEMFENDPDVTVL